MNLVNFESFNTTYKKITKKDLIIFLIPFIIFLCYLFIYNPGIVDVDPFNQLHQISTNQFTNWHPFFHTFIEMQLLNIFPSTLTICIFQIVLFSTFWTAICNYNRDENIPINSKQFVLQIIITLIISLIPINPILSISLHKDILFSYFLMFTCFLIKVLLDKKGNVSDSFFIVFSIVMAVTSQLRPNGIFVIITILLILSVYIYKNNDNKFDCVFLPALTIIFILLIASLNVAYDVEDTQKDAVFTKVSHMLADYDLNLEMNDADKQKLHEMISEEGILENYKISFSDPIYNIADKNVYENDKITYIKMAIYYSLKNPVHCIEYLLGSSPSVWDITRDSTWKGSVLNTYTDYTRDLYYQKAGLVPVGGYDNASFVNSGTQLYKDTESFISFTKGNAVISTLFYSPALYMYLSLIIILVIHMLTNSREIYLVYLPNLLNILAVFFSMPAQDVRYLYPNFLVFNLLLIILLYTKFSLNANKIQNNIAPIDMYQDENNYTFENDAKFNKLETSFPKEKETPEEMEVRIRAKVLKELEQEKKL